MKRIHLSYPVLIGLAIFLLLVGCSKEDSASLPGLSTSLMAGIEETSAICGGDITSDGGSSITARGVCWSTTENPTIDNSKTIDGTGAGVFTSALTDLIYATTYHVRAYATNSTGTAYGSDISFTTASALGGTLYGDNSDLLLGNPSNASTVAANNYLLYRPQYILSYNNSTKTPNWVSWHLYSGDIGSAPIQDDFRADATLPSSWYHITETDYQFSIFGFDMGQMCPPEERTATVADNSATFLMSNVIPLAPNLNQKTWANLEKYCRTLIDGGNELYIISGIYGKGGTGINGPFNALASGVVVPANIWKIIVVLPDGDHDLSRITTSTRVIAVMLPNINSINSNWKLYLVSVASLERLTGYTFLSALPRGIRDILAAKVDAGL